MRQGKCLRLDPVYVMYLSVGICKNSIAKDALGFNSLLPNKFIWLSESTNTANDNVHRAVLQVHKTK